MSQLEQVSDRNAQRMLKLAEDPQQTEYRLPKLYELAGSLLELAGTTDKLDASHPEFEVACRYIAADYLSRENVSTLSVLANLRFKQLEEVLAPEIFEFDQEALAELTEQVAAVGAATEGERIQDLIEYVVWSAAVRLYYDMVMDNPAIFFTSKVEDMPLGAGIKTAAKKTTKPAVHDPGGGGRLNLRLHERPDLSTLRGPVLRDWQDSLSMGAYYALSLIRQYPGKQGNQLKVLFALNYRNSEFCDDIHNSIHDYLESDASRRKGMLLGPAPLKPNMHIGDLFYSDYLRETGRALPNLIEERTLQYAIKRQKQYGKEAVKVRKGDSIISSAINTGVRSVEEFGLKMAEDPAKWRWTAYQKMIGAYSHVLDSMALQMPASDPRISSVIGSRIKDRNRANQAYLYAVRELVVRSKQALGKSAPRLEGNVGGEGAVQDVETQMSSVVTAIEAGQKAALDGAAEVLAKEYPELANIAASIVMKISLVVLHTPIGMFETISGMKPEDVQPTRVNTDLKFDDQLLSVYENTYQQNKKRGQGKSKPETVLKKDVNIRLEQAKRALASGDKNSALRPIANLAAEWRTDYMKAGLDADQAQEYADATLDQALASLGFADSWHNLTVDDLSKILDQHVVLGNPEDPSEVFSEWFSTRTKYDAPAESTLQKDFYLASSHSAMERLRQSHFVKRYEKNELEAKEWVRKYGRYFEGTDASMAVKEDIRERSQKFSAPEIEEFLQLPSIKAIKSPAAKKEFLQKMTNIFRRFPTIDSLQKALAEQGFGPEEIDPFFVNLSTRFFQVFRDDLVLSLANRFDADFQSSKRVDISAMPGERSKEDEGGLEGARIPSGRRFTLKDVQAADAVPIVEAGQFVTELENDIPFNKNGLIATYSLAGAFRDLYVFEAAARTGAEEHRARNADNLNKVVGEREVSPKEKAEDFYKEPMWGFVVTRLNQTLGKRFNNRNRKMLNELFIDLSRQQIAKKNIKDFAEEIGVFADPHRMIVGGSSTGVMPNRKIMIDTYADALDRAHSIVGPINGSYLEVVDRYAKYFADRKRSILAEAPQLEPFIIPYKKPSAIDTSPFYAPEILDRLSAVAPEIIKRNKAVEQKAKEADPDNIAGADAKGYDRNDDIQNQAQLSVKDDNEMARIFTSGEAGIDQDIGAALQRAALKLKPKMEKDFYLTPKVFIDKLFESVIADAGGYKRYFGIPQSSLRDILDDLAARIVSASKKKEQVKDFEKISYVIQPAAGYLQLITLGTLIAENDPPTGFSKEDALNRISITFDKIDEWNKRFSDLPQPDMSLATGILDYAKTQGFATPMDLATSPETERIIREGLAFVDAAQNNIDVDDPVDLRQHVIELSKTTEFFEDISEMMNTIGNPNYLSLLPIQKKLADRHAEFTKLDSQLRATPDADDTWRQNVELSLTRLEKLDTTGPLGIDTIEEKIEDQQEDAPTDPDLTPEPSAREKLVAGVQQIAAELQVEIASPDVERKFLEAGGDIDDFKAYATNVSAMMVPLIDAAPEQFEKVSDTELTNQLAMFENLRQQLRGEFGVGDLANFGYDEMKEEIGIMQSVGFPMGNAAAQLVKSSPKQPEAPAGQKPQQAPQVRTRADLIEDIRSIAQQISEGRNSSDVVMIADESGMPEEDQNAAYHNMGVIFNAIVNLPDAKFVATDGALEQFIESFSALAGAIGQDNILSGFSDAQSYADGIVQGGIQIDVADQLISVLGTEDVEELEEISDEEIQPDNGDRLMDLARAEVFADPSLQLEKLVVTDLAKRIQSRPYETGDKASLLALTAYIDNVVANPTKQSLKDAFSTKSVAQLKRMIDAAYSDVKSASGHYHLKVDSSDDNWYKF